MSRLLISLLVLTVLWQGGNATTFLRLSNFAQNILISGDSIVSTAGTYRMTLSSSGCQLRVQKFSGSSYSSVGSYTSATVPGDCASISLDPSTGNVVTQQNSVYMPMNQACNFTTLTIDDSAVIRLTCIPQRNSQIIIRGFEWNYTALQSNNSYMYSTSWEVVTIMSTLQPITNLGGWKLSANNGRLLLSSTTNPSQSATLDYTAFSIYPVAIQDQNGNEPPNVNFGKLRYEPRCGYLQYFTFKSPYLFTFDEFWPYFKFSDQSGYPILELMYPSVDCVADYGLTEDREWNCRVWFCPPELFSFKGSCVSTCPAPYFHFIKRNASRCAIICDEGATYDNISRICTCEPRDNLKCPSNSSVTISSCTCVTGFYDGYACVPQCGTGYFGLNGTCLTCPFKCATCVLNTQATKATYLICTACLPGYSLSSDAICRALCNGLVAQSANGNGTCFTCGDINCQLCSSQTTCTRCTPLYSLSNGQCLMNCSATQTAAFGGSGSFVCLSNIANCLTITTAYINGTGYLQCLSCNVGTYIYGDSCVTTCPAGTNPDSTTSSCKCATVGYILINKVCTQMTTCPIKMYYNNTINACLACPYGCLTCTGAPDVCYSCALGYIYFAYSSPFCGFNSPFYQCIVGYTLDAATRRCLPDVVALEYMGCRAAAPGCSVCLYQSSITCIVCQNGTFLYMNQCLLGCPNGTWAYLGVCTQNNPYDQNCLTQGIRSNSSYFYSNTTSVSNSAMYPWYIQNLNLLDNNPITTLLYNSIFDNTTRPSYWRQSYYYCEKCKDGYGVAPNGSCSSCSLGCATCITTSSNWCITCQSGYNLTYGRMCVGGGSNTNFTCPTGQFLNTNNVCIDSSNCTNFYVVDQKRCWYDAPVGTAISRQTGVNYLTARPAINGKGEYLKMEAASYLLDNNAYLVFFVPYDKFAEVNNIVNAYPNWYFKNTPGKPLMTNVTNGTTADYLLINTTKQADIMVIDTTRTLRSMRSANGLYPANSIYGVKYGSTRNNLIKYDLAFIGYVFSVAMLVMWLLYIGSDIMYKVDNLMILMQVIYFFLYVRAVIDIGLAQFYYGFRYSHFGFFPNLFRNTMPANYYEYAPVAYRLVDLDGNIVRNAGYSFSVLVIFLGGFLVAVAVLAMLKWWFHKPAGWRPHLITNILQSVLELLMMNIIFFSVAEVRYSDRWPVNNYNYKTTCWGVAIFFMVFYGIYSLVRLWFSKIAGIYCIKRYIFAVIMACCQNDFVVCALYIEVAFMLLRLLIERPATRSQLALLLGQEILMIVAFTIMMFCRTDNVTIILVSFIVMGLFFAILWDLTQVYTDYNNEWDYDEDEQEKTSHEYMGTGRLRS